MSYTTRVKVRFGDIDHAGIAYYPNLYHYFHIAFEDFFEDFIGTPYPDLLDRERIGFPTVKVETEFIRPIKYGDSLHIAITVETIGKTSVVFVFTATRHGDPVPAIVSRQTVVAVDMNTFRPVPVPDHLRDLFSRCFTAS